MILHRSAFRSDVIEFNLIDIIKLLLGYTIECSAMRISLWRMPKDEQ